MGWTGRDALTGIETMYRVEKDGNYRWDASRNKCKIPKNDFSAEWKSDRYCTVLYCTVHVLRYLCICPLREFLRSYVLQRSSFGYCINIIMVLSNVP